MCQRPLTPPFSQRWPGVLIANHFATLIGTYPLLRKWVSHGGICSIYFSKFSFIYMQVGSNLHASWSYTTTNIMITGKILTFMAHASTKLKRMISIVFNQVFNTTMTSHILVASCLLGPVSIDYFVVVCDLVSYVAHVQWWNHACFRVICR